MDIKVVDASAIGALLFGEPEGPEIAERLEGDRLIAPYLLPFEVASICRKKLQCHAMQRRVILKALAMFEDMDIERIEINLPSIVLLAEQTGLTIYDAATSGWPDRQGRNWLHWTKGLPKQLFDVSPIFIYTTL